MVPTHLQLLLDLIRLNEDAMQDKASLPIEDAFDGPLLERWLEIKGKVEAMLAASISQPQAP